MTDDIDNIPAGPELDALIARELMGWIVTADKPKDGRESFGDGYAPGVEIVARNLRQIPRYSTDIAAAWSVRDKLAEAWEIHLESHGLCGNSTDESCFLQDHAEYAPVFGTAPKGHMPLAICRAALKAVRSAPAAPREPQRGEG